MAMNITDLPGSRALDYKAMSAIRGAGPGDWVLSAFLPYRPSVAPISPIVNFYQTNYIADNNGQVKVMDFGIARALDGQDT